MSFEKYSEVLKIRNLKLVFIVILLTSWFLNAQTDDITTLNANSYKAIKTFTPPSDKFISIKLQTYKGLLRFGEQDNYYKLPDGSYVNHKSKTAYEQADKKNWEIALGRHALLELLRFKYMSPIYEDMDKTLLTKRSNSMYQKEKNSFTAQSNLLRLASAVTSAKDMPRFFCNPKAKDCTYDPGRDLYFHRNVGSGEYWGGQGASEFKQLGAFTSYVNENFEELQEWKTNFFPNDVEEGYFVIGAHLGIYDFENKGYWIRSQTFRNNGKLFRFMDLQAANSNERKLVHPQGVEILYKISPEEAEKHTEETKNLFLVFKVKVQIKGMEYNNENVHATYSLQSPIIELYKDDSLTHKFGEISIETMTTK
ncbi:hypothetical protein [Spongiimicrobium sp. 3-5]|uniref:hypothetical protein n=1 Tax=Spongiimicrobium sp. 3-5 TaxID=3332596 RepID=UPI0039819040